MSQYDDSGFKTFEASAAIAKHARVKLEAGGTIVTAGLADKEIGTALQEAFASGDRVAVKLRTAPGTHKMIAADALTPADPVFTQASGKIGDSEGTGFLIGTVVDTAGADGDIVEVIYNAHGDTVVP